MARAAPPKATTYGKPRGKVIPPKKQPSPTPENDDETVGEDAPEGKLLEEMDESIPTPKTKSKATTAKPKSILKSTNSKKGNQTSLPSPAKAAPKSKLSKEMIPTPSPKAKAQIKSKSNGNTSESDFNSDEEKIKVAAKSQPKPIKGKKGDSSQLPSSNDSTKSSIQSRSTSTRKAAISAKNEIFKKPVALEEDEDEFDGEFDNVLADALEDFETKGMSSSPTITAKVDVKQPPIPPPAPSADIIMDAVEDDEGAKSPQSQLSDAGEPAEVADVEETREEVPEDKDEEMSSPDDDDNEDDSQSPDPKTRTPAPRSVKKLDLKRAADYDSNLIAESEGGLAGYLLADMASPTKKPRTSVLPDKIRKLEAAATKPSPRPPVQKSLATPKNARGKKAQAPLPPPIDYASMIAPYGKEVVQRLMLKQFESIKKCDWYELSVEMAAEGVRRVSSGKKGKKTEEKDIINGNELHDLFHNVRRSMLDRADDRSYCRL